MFTILHINSVEKMYEIKLCAVLFPLQFAEGRNELQIIQHLFSNWVQFFICFFNCAEVLIMIIKFLYISYARYTIFTRFRYSNSAYFWDEFDLSHYALFEMYLRRLWNTVHFLDSHLDLFYVSAAQLLLLLLLVIITLENAEKQISRSRETQSVRVLADYWWAIRCFPIFWNC